MTKCEAKKKEKKVAIQTFYFLRIVGKGKTKLLTDWRINLLTQLFFRIRLITSDYILWVLFYFVFITEYDM